MYRANAARREQQQRHANIDEFLRSLEMEVEIQAATPFSVPRIAQLTQKTNQWNMTTRRYTEAQIEAFARDPGRAVLSVASRDRFGSDGIVGVCILEFAGDVCTIDTFLMSCRVIGRGLEQLMLSEAARLARARGARTLAAQFVPTRKNTPAEGFYERAGLQPDAGGWFRAGLDTTEFPCPPHIRFAPAGTAPAPAR
jgi:FkbH-like protein